MQVTSLLDQLIQLSKTGFTKATQRLDGIYALFSVSRLAAIDTKAGLCAIFFQHPRACFYVIKNQFLIT